MTPVIHDSIEDAQYDVVHYSAVPAKAIATDINVPLARLYAAASRESEQPFHASWIVPITKATKNDAILRFLARAVGGVFIRLPEVGTSSLHTMVDAVGVLMREVADVIRVSGEVLADGRVDAAEKAALIEQMREARHALDVAEHIVLTLPDEPAPTARRVVHLR